MNTSRRRRLFTSTLALALAAATTGCGVSDDDTDGWGQAQEPLAHPGPWEIPLETLQIGDTQYVDYTGAGPWYGESSCSGGMTPGNDVLREYLYAHFPQTYSIGGYSCRHINGDSSQTSVHATGRALDVMLPLDSGEADNDLGDPIGNWLIENAEAIGIQYIIWDRYSWNASRAAGTKDKSYGGAHPHHDHLHVELSVEMSNNTSNWFEDDVDPPGIDGCNVIPSDGAIIEETDKCFTAFGPAEYWRQQDAGSGGSLIWTNAWESDGPSNWARWRINVPEDDDYTVEVYVDADWGVHQQTPYLVRHAVGEDLIEVDQSIEHGWVNLGDFHFMADSEQYVDVYDDMPDPVADDQHIAVDALRLTRVGADPPEGPDDPGSDPNPDDPAVSVSASVEGEAEGGCSTNGKGDPGGLAWIAFALSLVGLRRRRT